MKPHKPKTGEKVRNLYQHLLWDESLGSLPEKEKKEERRRTYIIMKIR